MDYQYNIDNYKQISADCDKQLKIYINSLDKIIDTADNVFVFRAHNHIKKENDLVKWCKSISENTLEEVNFIFKRFNNRELSIKSSDGSCIYNVVLDKKDNRTVFKELFKIDYSSFRNNFSTKMLNNIILIDDAEYDQYDYIFIKNSNVMAWTFTHELEIFIHEDIYE